MEGFWKGIKWIISFRFSIMQFIYNGSWSTGRSQQRTWSAFFIQNDYGSAERAFYTSAESDWNRAEWEKTEGHAGTGSADLVSIVQWWLLFHCRGCWPNPMTCTWILMKMSSLEKSQTNYCQIPNTTSVDANVFKTPLFAFWSRSDKKPCLCLIKIQVEPQSNGPNPEISSVFKCHPLMPNKPSSSQQTWKVCGYTWKCWQTFKRTYITNICKDIH